MSDVSLEPHTDTHTRFITFYVSCQHQKKSGSKPLLSYYFVVKGLSRLTERSTRDKTTSQDFRSTDRPIVTQGGRNYEDIFPCFAADDLFYLQKQATSVFYQ